MLGKSIRIERIVDRASGNAVVVPMDHGLSMGPIEGISDMRRAVGEAAEGGATAVIMQKGMVAAGHRGCGRDVGLIVHLSGSTQLSQHPNDKVLVASVEEAVRLGADAVSMQVNIGAEGEPRMLADLGEVSAQCSEWGMPLLAMVYAWGASGRLDGADAVARCARVAGELGADIVKVSYTGSVDTFAKVVEGAGVPVLVAGGPKAGSTEEMLAMVHGSMQAGGRGASIGRNVFQAADVRGTARAVADIVLRGATVREAMERLEAGRRCRRSSGSSPTGRTRSPRGGSWWRPRWRRALPAPS